MIAKWKIGTCNIRGLNNQDKQDDTINWHIENHLTISSITETRTSPLTNRFLKNHYKEVLIYATTDPDDINGSGIAIIIDRALSAHIYEIQEVPGRTITLVIKFKGKVSIAITSIYNKANRDKRISRRITEHLEKLNNIQYQIIMSDFNENQSKSGPISKFLKKKNMVNLARLEGKETENTWYSGNRVSTIDYIWTTATMAGKFTNFGIHDPEEWLDTDHRALIATMDTEELEHRKIKPRKKHRKIFNIRKARDKNWNEWKEQVLIAAQEIEKKGQQDNNLNRQWNTIRNIITKAARHHFSLKKVPKEQAIHNKRECEKYKAERTLSAIIKETNHITTLGLINKLGETHAQEANSILQATPTQRIIVAKTLRKTIRKARMVEAAL